MIQPWLQKRLLNHHTSIKNKMKGAQHWPCARLLRSPSQYVWKWQCTRCQVAIPIDSETDHYLDGKMGGIQGQRWKDVLNIFLGQIKQSRHILSPIVRPMQCPFTILDVIHQIWKRHLHVLLRESSTFSVLLIQPLTNPSVLVQRRSRSNNRYGGFI